MLWFYDQQFHGKRDKDNWINFALYETFIFKDRVDTDMKKLCIPLDLITSFSCKTKHSFKVLRCRTF